MPPQVRSTQRSARHLHSARGVTRSFQDDTRTGAIRSPARSAGRRAGGRRRCRSLGRPRR
eukprot:scaffold2751_cov344-Prasinococcus_capsulatus_cf.AAC.7